MAQVRRGEWRPPVPEVGPDQNPDPTFHEFASDWFAAVPRQLRPNTVADYEWQLAAHLLPFFGQHRLSQITVREVDRYRDKKVREGRLSPTSINKTITRLGQIIERAVEYDLVVRNPVRVNATKRKLKVTRPGAAH